jgi:N-acetylglucosaminyldiphosphoundecaprenol N-acetyl-beta-D-mannosaminyltransferase
VNLHFLVTAHRDATVLGILRRSSLNVADGAPVLWLARVLGRRLPERVTGADLLPRLMAAAAKAGARVFLLGGRDGVAVAAGARLERQYPGLRICGVHEPPVTSVEGMDNPRILRQISDSGADILVLSLSHPKPEKWIDMHRAQLPVSVAINVGCTLDLVTGRRSRAPLWMQRSGLEWLYRALHEPARLLPRYALDAGWLLFAFLPRALGERLTRGVRGAL